MKEYGWVNNNKPGEWGRIDSWDRQMLVLNNLKRSTLPVFLGLQGGEPTIHPRYTEFVDKCHNAVSVHEDGRLYITTNGLRGPEFFKKQKYHEHLMYLWSFHVEEYERYGNNFERIVDSIKVTLDKGNRSRVNVMLHSDKKFWDVLHRFVDIIEDIPEIEIHPHWIYADGDPHKGTEKYDIDFYEQFKRFENYPSWLVYEDGSGNTTKLNDYNIFNSKSFNFHGWDCWHNNYEITWDGKVSKECFPGPIADLIKAPFFFKRITEVEPVKCPHTACTCDGHLKIYKEKHEG
jgi:MoaA/NifB/PqqE/SkfB family radical SAM enzyme